MKSRGERTFRGDFRTFFLRGLVVLLPSVLTLWIVVQAYFFVERRVAEPINAGVRYAVVLVAPMVMDEERLPEWFKVSEDRIAQLRQQRQEEGLREVSDAQLRNEQRAANLREYWNTYWYLRFIGLVVAIVLIYLAGRLLGGFIGRRIYERFERLMTSVPVFKQVYPHVKQIVDFIFGQQEKLRFNRVVLVEYPRKGIWTVGLLTGASMRDIAQRAGGDSVTIFIPSSPTPFTGYTITVPKQEAIDLPITIEEALRFVVSGGVIVPQSQAMEPEQIAEQVRRGDLAAGSDRGKMETEQERSDASEPEGSDQGDQTDQDRPQTTERKG